MGWWADYWNSVAQFFGYSEWVWGSAADWFAAIGTVGALLLTYAVLRRELRLSREADANSLIANKTIVVEGSKRGTPAYLEVDAINTGTSPITSPQVHALIRSGENLQTYRGNLQPVRADGSNPDRGVLQHFEIAGGERGRLRMQVPSTSRLMKCYLSFTDHRGRSWIRDLSTFDYVSPRVLKEFEEDGSSAYDRLRRGFGASPESRQDFR